MPHFGDLSPQLYLLGISYKNKLTELKNLLKLVALILSWLNCFFFFFFYSVVLHCVCVCVCERETGPYEIRFIISQIPFFFFLLNSFFFLNSFFMVKLN